MRSNDVWKSVKIKEATKITLESMRDDFEKSIGGGTWSLDDAVNELIKIARGVKK